MVHCWHKLYYLCGFHTRLHHAFIAELLSALHVVALMLYLGTIQIPLNVVVNAQCTLDVLHTVCVDAQFLRWVHVS